MVVGQHALSHRDLIPKEEHVPAAYGVDELGNTAARARSKVFISLMPRRLQLAR